MGQRIKIHKKLYREFNDTKINCEVCVFKEKRTCSYLEKVMNYHPLKKKRADLWMHCLYVMHPGTAHVRVRRKKQ